MGTGILYRIRRPSNSIGYGSKRDFCPECKKDGNSFAEIWAKSIKENMQESDLKKEDLENSKLYIETDKEKGICNIYIISKSTDFIGSFSFYIDENYNKYIDEFLSCLKDMFF